MLKKIYKTLVLILLLQVTSFAQTISIKEQINNDAELNNTSIGFYAVEAKTGNVLVDINSNKNLKPASNLKLLTTIAALKILGGDTRFETKIMYSGYFDDDDILAGDLYIIGGGDPTIASKYFKKDKNRFLTEIKAALKKAHIKTVEGNLIIVDTLFKGQATPTTWVWGDIGNYYGAGVSSFAIFDNQYKIYFNTKVKLNDTVKILKIYPETDISLINEVTATKTRRDKSNIYGSELSNKRVITGELPINKDSFIVKGSILNPEQVLANYIKFELEKDSSLRIKGKTIIQKKTRKSAKLNLLFTYKSPTVKEIIEKTNLYSVNLFAEMLLRHIDVKLNGKGTNYSATKKLKNYWVQQGLNNNNMKFYDGSGLSSYNIISTKQLVKALQFAYADSIFFNSFISTLPIGGKSGTLKTMFKNTDLVGKVYAKSGSMSAVKAYSGYIFINDDKNPIIFSIIFNNFTLKSNNIKAKIQQLIVRLSKK